MPRPRAVMRKIREVLRLALGEQLSQRRVKQITGVPEATQYDYVRRARAAGLAVWPPGPVEIDDQELERRLFVRAGPPVIRRPVPEWSQVKNELQRKGVTMQLLHEEYLERHPGGYQYSQFCRLYKEWRRHLDVVLRQDHQAGKKMFVDFPGQTVPIYDPETQAQVMAAQIFVSVLGCGARKLVWVNGES